MTARAEPDCCCPFSMDMPTSFEVTIGPVGDLDCDHPDTLAKELAEIIAKGVMEVEGGI